MDDLLVLVKGKSASDPQLRAVRKKVKKGTADFNDTAQYSEALSKLIGKNLSANILDIPPDVREELSTELLEYGYTDINELLNDVQISLDEKNGINIRPQRADFPTERVEQFVHSLIDPTVDDSTIKRRAKAGSETITKSFHDDYMKKNAAFRSDAGLKCYIVRTAAYKCCEWCSNIAGRYPYNVDEMPEDVFRRHDNCDCRTILENGRERQDVWSKRTWEVPETGPGAESPAVFTEKQAKAIEQRNLQQFRGVKINNPSIDNSEKNGIIETEVKQEMNLVIDKFTPCLEDTETGELVPTVYEKATKKELSELQGWNFNWLDKDLKDSEIYKLCIVGDNNIQGLVAITDYQKDMAVYVNIAESAPHNLGKDKKYSGVGGHLFAIAAKISYDKGYGGFLFMDAKNTELVEHYRNTLGAVLIGRPHPHRMFVDEENAIKLLNMYTFEEG